MFRSLSLRISMLRLRGGLFGSEAVSSNKRTVLGREMRGGSQREFTLCKMLLVNVPTWHYDLVLTKDCLFQKIDHSGRSSVLRRVKGGANRQLSSTIYII